MRHQIPPRPTGFTLIEMLIAMVVGVLVLSAAMTVGLSTFRSLTGVQLRDGIDRNARFIGLALQRPPQPSPKGRGSRSSPCCQSCSSIFLSNVEPLMPQ